MIVSQGYEFVFIHIPKNAGTSISSAIPGQMLPGTKHKTYLEIPNEFKKYYPFAVVRNPWDRMVSFYYYLKKLGKIEEDMSFSKFILLLGSMQKMYNYHSLKTQRSFLVDERGEVAVDEIIRYERLEDDFRRVYYRRLDGLPMCPVFLHLNKTEHAPYQSFYTSRTKHIVGKHFCEDIVEFGYVF